MLLTRRLLTRRLLTSTVLAAFVLGGAGCSLIGGTDDDLPQGYVSVGITRPADLLPSNVSDAGGTQVLGALFTPLVTYDAEHRPVPAAAASITSVDKRVWTITLAAGYTFHNGEQVTARSYLDAWNYAAYGPHKQRNSYLFERIEGFVEVQGATPASTTLSGLKQLNPRTFTVTLVTPFGDFPAMLGHPAFSPLPTAAFASPGVLADGFADAVVGQGPFKLTGPVKSGDPIDVRRVDTAVRPPKVAGVRFLVYDDQGKAYADLLDDVVDVVAAIPDDKIADAGKKLGNRLQTTPGSSLTMLAFPSADRTLAEPAVRQAVSMAIDRDRIVGTLFPGAQTPARAFVPPSVVGYQADACGQPCAYDPVNAKIAYQKAGGPPTLRIAYNSDGGHQAWVDATCAQLTANLGITCTGAPEPTFANLLTKVRGGQPVGLFRLTWFMDYPSMESYLNPLFATDGSSNFERYQNSDFDEALRDATAAKDPAVTLAGYRRAETLLAADMPVIPLRFSLDVTGHSTRVTGVTLDAFDRVDLSALSLS